jgi:hypothetical protein
LKVNRIFCQTLAWRTDDELHPVVLGYHNDLYRSNGIHFSSLRHLDDIGIVKFITEQTFALTDFQLPISYFDTPSNIHLEGAQKKELTIGNILLTKVGEELAKISGAEEVEGFFEYSLTQWHNRNHNLSSPFPRSKTN